MEKESRPKKPIYKKWWFLVIVVVVVFVVIGATTGSPENATQEPEDEGTDNISSDPPDDSEELPNAPSTPEEDTDEDVNGDEEVSQAAEPEIFEPIHYSGSGDSVLEIDEPDGMYVFQISGNESGNHFAVKSYDENGESLDLLVNTTSVYNGTTLGSTNGVKLLEISANGEWSIDLVSIYNMPSISAGETYSGANDTVIQINTDGLTAEISGNENERHFSVKSYDINWNYIDLLVNTTDICSGTVMLTNSPDFLVINADGSWSITLE